MAATRKTFGNTSQAAAALIEAIESPQIQKITLFASNTKAKGDQTYRSDSDGPESNLPLLAALAEATNGDLDVFDGVFLTAARSPRYGEVREVLDVAVKTEKVFFAVSRAPFTSRLPATTAANALSQLSPIEQLTDASRAKFFRLLSNLTEAEHQKL